jgi:hypothetical protein
MQELGKQPDSLVDIGPLNLSRIFWDRRYTRILELLCSRSEDHAVFACLCAIAHYFRIITANIMQQYDGLFAVSQGATGHSK